MIDPAADSLTESRLRAALGGRPFQYFPQVGSTSDLAREWAAEGATAAPDGALVIADVQIAGRGRFDRRWYAPAGTALTFSVIVRLPPPLVSYVQRLSIAGAMAVLYGVERVGAQRITLKWPNDVLLDGRKLAGILAESDWDGDHLIAAIVGIGLNVRVPFGTLDNTVQSEDVPLAERAVSLEPTLSQSIDRIALLADILERLSFWTARLADPALIAGWRSRLATLGTRVTVRTISDPMRSSAQSAVTGIAVDADANGALLVQDDAGQLHRFTAGETSLR